MNKNIEYYLHLPYTLELSYDPEHAWFIRVKELPGCTSQGETPDEAVAMVKDAMQLWIEDALEEGVSVPEPRPDDDFSGKFNLRVPVSLHRKLSVIADEDGVSLNTFCVAALSESVGHSREQKKITRNETQGGASTTQIPSWPGLTVGARRAMLAAGFVEEAGRIDEQLFVKWFDDQFTAFSSALEQGYTRDALADLENLTGLVRIGKQFSPAMGALEQVLEVLKAFVKHSSQLHADPMYRMRELLLETFEPIKERMVTETRKSYSVIATRTESSLAEQLFHRD